MKRLFALSLLVLFAIGVRGQDLEQIVIDSLASRVNDLGVTLMVSHDDGKTYQPGVSGISLGTFRYDGTEYLDEAIIRVANEQLQRAANYGSIGGMQLVVYTVLFDRNIDDWSDSTKLLLAGDSFLDIPEDGEIPQGGFTLPVTFEVGPTFPVYVPDATAVRVYQTLKLDAAFPGLGFPAEDEWMDEVPLTEDDDFVRIPRKVLRDQVEMYGGTLVDVARGRIEIDYADGSTVVYSLDEYGLSELLEPWPNRDTIGSIDNSVPVTTSVEPTVDPALSISFADGERTLTITGAPNTVYSVLETHDPSSTDWKTWQEITTDSDGLASVIDDREISNCFFRVTN